MPPDTVHLTGLAAAVNATDELDEPRGKWIRGALTVNAAGVLPGAAVATTKPALAPMPLQADASASVAEGAIAVAEYSRTHADANAAAANNRVDGGYEGGGDDNTVETATDASAAAVNNADHTAAAAATCFTKDGGLETKLTVVDTERGKGHVLVPPRLPSCPQLFLPATVTHKAGGWVTEME